LIAVEMAMKSAGDSKEISLIEMSINLKGFRTLQDGRLMHATLARAQHSQARGFGPLLLCSGMGEDPLATQLT
jgi:hypothetical protein